MNHGIQNEEVNQFENRLLELRMAEIETHRQVDSALEEVHRRRLWKAGGFKSLADYLRGRR